MTPQTPVEPAADPAPGGLRWFASTDRGRYRSNNEDSFLGLRFNDHDAQHLGRRGEASLANTDFVFAVSDGMGGAKAGEYASRIAVEKITKLLPRAFKQSAEGLQAGFADVLGELYEEVHRALVYLGGSYEECHGMETTLSLCWFTPGWMFFGHVGDSRIYYLPRLGGQLKQLTHDDTHVGWLLRNKRIREYEARAHPGRNVLQKSLGGGNQFVEPQVGAVGIQPGDQFLLCTDGLSDGLYEHQMADLLRQPPGDTPAASPASRLVDTSVANSGRDNTTAVVVQIL